MSAKQKETEAKIVKTGAEVTSNAAQVDGVRYVKMKVTPKSVQMSEGYSV